MPRIAVGDLFIDIELPSTLDCYYEVSGSMLAMDKSGKFELRCSGITVTVKDASVENTCVSNVHEAAAKAGHPCVSISDSLNYYYTPALPWTHDLSILNEFWFVGCGNRELILTLTYTVENESLLDFDALHSAIVAAIKSVRLTHPNCSKLQERIAVYDLVSSQQPWLDHHRREFVGHVLHCTGFDDGWPVPLPVLDDFWTSIIARPPTDEDTVNAILNGLGVALGDHLVGCKSFEWVVVNDSYGAYVGIVALRGSANVSIDPFNFVAKRWENREPAFLQHSVGSISATVDEFDANWNKGQRLRPWWAFWRPKIPKN